MASRPASYTLRLASAPRAVRAVPALHPRFTRPSSTSSPKPTVPTKEKGKVDNVAESISNTSDIPPLQRPLGIPEHPTAVNKTWKQKRRDMLDDDRAKEKTKVLLAEAKQGYFHDYNRARKGGGGKLWIAPSVLIREDRANYFPDISGKNLLGTNVHTTDLFAGKATLVSIISTRLSEEHVQTFSQPVLEDLEGHPRFQSVTINHQPNSLKTWIVSMFTSSLKRTIPKENWGNYIYATSSWSELDILQPLNLDNHLLGYTFLVDQNCKVRWAGCGEATEEERQNLRRAAAVLVGRMKGGSIKAEGEPSA
ncbi:hypothetical protein B9479_005340 [Cryptococcus floricola]|uniref:Mitochondrial ATPase complex subunit ATP10 n=1 Tax=Cryptococcus floricola TaxID=2591691 RepID=A0A5D3AW10_9TREE|nr:hypothetical protein B9479_005340 [Cryptococcus floricola]